MFAEFAVDGQRLGEVVLRGERLHEVAVAAFAQWGKLDELTAGPYGAGQFGAAEAQFGGGVALEARTWISVSW